MRNKEENCEETVDSGEIDSRSFKVRLKWYKADISKDRLQAKQAFAHYPKGIIKSRNIRKGIHSE